MMGQAIPHFQNVPGRALAGDRPAMSSLRYSQSQPSLPNQHGGEPMFQTRNQRAGNFPAKDTRDIPAFSITQGDWLKRVQESMHEEAGNRPGKAKYLAALIECSPKTTQSWLDGETAPSGILDLRAMNRLPAYAALKREIAQLETTMDPRLQAKYQELHRLTLELAGG